MPLASPPHQAENPAEKCRLFQPFMLRRDISGP
jgi:hypothetical protein